MPEADKYARDGETFARRLRFSDTYVRTPGGWTHVFGQASIALPGLECAEIHRARFLMATRAT